MFRVDTSVNLSSAHFLKRSINILVSFRLETKQCQTRVSFLPSFFWLNGKGYIVGGSEASVAVWETFEINDNYTCLVHIHGGELKF
jgi:hypothetical protein